MSTTIVSKRAEQVRKASLKYYYSNKESCAARASVWRQENREYVRTKQREMKRQRKIEAIDYLGGVCKRCNQQQHPAVFEFHHRNPDEKDRDPSKLLGLSWEKIVQELDKCDLLCANCHRLTHHGDSYGNH